MIRRFDCKILVLCAVVLGVAGNLAAAVAGTGSSGSGTSSLARELDRSGIPLRFGIGSADAPGSGTQLEGYLQLALHRNQLLQSRYAEYLAADAAIGEVTSLPDPKLGYTEYLNPVETRIGPQERAVSVSQSFPWFGSLSLRGEVRRAYAEAARSQLHAAVLKVIAEVKRAYYEIGFLENAVQTTTRHIVLLTSWEEIARARYSSGAGKYTDVIKAQVELGILKNRLLELQDQERPVAADLNALLNRESTAAVVYDDPPPPAASDPGLAALLDRLQAGNPGLAVWSHRAQASLDADQLARKNGYPSFTLGLNYILTGSARTSGLPDSGQDALMASLAVSLPIWRGKHDAAAQVAVNRYHAAVTAKQDLANTLSTGLERAHYQYRDARRQAELYRTTLVPKGNQSLGATRAAYEAGDSSFLELVDAERLVLEFELSLIRAEFDVLSHEAVIEEFIAGPLDGPVAGAPPVVE